MNYEKSKNEFLKIKNQIDDEIKKHGITKNLLNYEKDLENSYQKVKLMCWNEQDERYINFNYFPCKACISLAKGYIYKPLKEWLIGFKNFIEYTNEVKNANKWEEGIDYYRSRLSRILQNRIEIFGDSSAQRFDEIDEIIDAFKNTINAISTTNSLLIKIQETLIEAIDSIVVNSKEIYTEEHLSRKEKLVDLLKKFENGNNYIIGMKSRIEFILLKREFHYYLREILKNKKPDELKLREVIKQMKRTAGTEKNNFKKVGDRKDIDWKKFLSEIDGLTAEYYDALWLGGNLIEAINRLERIFSKIRDNLNIILTASMFQHFVNEFLFLQNYLKLLLVAKDFKDFAQKDGVYEWQKKLSEDISNEIVSIAEKNFKYDISISQNVRRSLLIVEESLAGKVLEFIIFYLLKELINHKSQALLKLNEIRNDDIRNFMELVLNSKSEEVRWSHRFSDIEIDIFVSDKYAIFLKTGIIGSSDRKRIQKELEVSKKYDVFYLLDIAKNLDVVRSISSRYDNQITLIDIGVFLNEIYEFAKKVGVQMELTRSSIKSLTGFYSGG
jgi:hypothetical protein